MAGAAAATIEAPEGATVLALAEAISSHGELIHQRLGSLVPIEDPFVARNEEAWRDGVLVHVAAGVRVEEPIRIEVRVEQDGVAVNRRTLVVLDEGAEAEVWEHSASPGDGVDALLNSVVELVIGPGARLRYLSTQDISELGLDFLLATSGSGERRAARLDRPRLWLKGRQGADGDKPGRARRRGAGQRRLRRRPGQHLDYDTTQEHSAPNTSSDLAFRGVLAARSTAVWRGMIKVDPGAQQTDAFQESRNLLLSTEAHADAIPGLEILADDVRCTHAAAIAQIDRDQLVLFDLARAAPRRGEGPDRRGVPGVARRATRRGAASRRGLSRAGAASRRGSLPNG